MSAPVPAVLWKRCPKQPDAIVEPCAGGPGCSNRSFDQEEHDYYRGHLVCESVDPRFRGLIAAAPLLLAALRQFHQEATRYHKDCGHGVEGSAAAECDSICECIPAAEAAIAKAEGR